MSCHSRLDEMWREKMAGRWAKKASQIKKIKRRRPISEIIEPIDEITFQQV